MKQIMLPVSVLTLVLFGTHAQAKGVSNAQIKNAVAKNLSRVIGAYPSACNMGSYSVVDKVTVVKKGKYNSKQKYYPYVVDIAYRCEVRRGMGVPGFSKPSTRTKTAKIKLYKDDFGEYKASKLY